MASRSSCDHPSNFSRALLGQGHAAWRVYPMTLPLLLTTAVQNCHACPMSKQPSLLPNDCTARVQESSTGWGMSSKFGDATSSSRQLWTTVLNRGLPDPHLGLLPIACPSLIPGDWDHSNCWTGTIAIVPPLQCRQACHGSSSEGTYIFYAFRRRRRKITTSIQPAKAYEDESVIMSGPH